MDLAREQVRDLLEKSPTGLSVYVWVDGFFGGGNNYVQVDKDFLKVTAKQAICDYHFGEDFVASYSPELNSLFFGG